MNLSNILSDKKINVDYLFYFSAVLLSLVIFSYFMFDLKLKIQEKKINELDSAFVAIGMGDGQIYNKKVIEYKRKIDDFALVLDSHRSTSNIFEFIEKNTLKNVWFSSFSIQQKADKILLSGEASDLGVLSKQIEMFESQRDYVLDISVLNSENAGGDRVSFVLDIVLSPEVFNVTVNSNNSQNVLEGVNP